MSDPYLGHLGNVEEYHPERQRVSFEGLVTHPSLFLKLYSMFEKRPFFGIVNRAKGHILAELEKGNIDPQSGLGFAILSEDALNIARWSRENPIILVNQLYEYEKSKHDTPEPLDIMEGVKPMDIREAGSYCIWELGIVNHERYAWLRYLASKRTEADKKAYLGDVIKEVFLSTRSAEERLKEAEEKIEDLEGKIDDLNLQAAEDGEIEDRLLSELGED